MRNYHTPKQWQTLIQEFDKSSLTVKAFCQQHKLSVSSFYLWRNRFGQPSSAVISSQSNLLNDNHSPNWLKLSPEEPSPPASAAPSTPWDIELTLPAGLMLRMRVPSC